QAHQFTDVVVTCVKTVGLQIPVGNAQQLQTCLGQHARVMGMADTFWIMLLIYLACIVLTLLLGRDPALMVHKQRMAKELIIEQTPESLHASTTQQVSSREPNPLQIDDPMVEQKEEEEHDQDITWRRKLELYADEIAALQAEFDDLSLRMEAQRARLQK